MSLKDKLLKNTQLISISEINISYDSSKTIGYDLTVEDYYTFASSDGIFVQDTMAVFLPLSNDAQEEIQSKMMRLEAAETSKSLVFEFSKEMLVGLYCMTKPIQKNQKRIFVTTEDLEKINDPYIPVSYRSHECSSGIAIFNSCFPKDFKFIIEQPTKKLLHNIFQELIKKYNIEIVRECSVRVEKIAFKFATIIAPSLHLKDAIIPKEVYEVKKEVDKLPPDKASEVIKETHKLVQKYLNGTGWKDIIESGSAKGWSQTMQILAVKGITSDATGKVLPAIRSSLGDGLNSEEYFNATYGARMGIIMRTITTATTGYGARKLAYILNVVEASPTVIDCKTNRTLNIKLIEQYNGRFEGRYIINEKGNVELFDSSKYKVGDMIKLRSPIFCKNSKICHTCYGKLLERHKTPYVGLYSAMKIGERGTNISMRSFHDNSVKIESKNILKDIIDNENEIKLEL